MFANLIKKWYESKEIIATARNSYENSKKYDELMKEKLNLLEKELKHRKQQQKLKQINEQLEEEDDYEKEDDYEEETSTNPDDLFQNLISKFGQQLLSNVTPPKVTGNQNQTNIGELPKVATDFIKSCSTFEQFKKGAQQYYPNVSDEVLKEVYGVWHS